MELIEGIKLKGRPVEIPDSTRDGLPKLFVDLGFKIGAEIGVWKGEYSELFCKASLIHYAIDPWVSYKGYSVAGGNTLSTQYERAKKLLEPYKNCTIIKKTSMDALADFKDESLDYVYIDGNHGFRYIAEDLVEWSKKVKKGGVISGHDYVYFPESTDSYVRYMVDTYTQAFDIHNWFVLGRKDEIEGEKRDKWRSFMWFKP